MASFPFLSVNSILISFRVVMCPVPQNKLLLKPIVEFLLLLAKYSLSYTPLHGWGCGLWPKSGWENKELCLGLLEKSFLPELKQQELQNYPWSLLLWSWCEDVRSGAVTLELVSHVTFEGKLQGLWSRRRERIWGCNHVIQPLKKL